MSSGAVTSHVLSWLVLYAEVSNIRAPYLDDAIASGRRAELAKDGQIVFLLSHSKHWRRPPFSPRDNAPDKVHGHLDLFPPLSLVLFIYFRVLSFTALARSFDFTSPSAR